MLRTMTRTVIGLLLVAGVSPAATQDPSGPDSLERIQREVAEAREAKTYTPAACLDWIERCHALADAAQDPEERYQLLRYPLGLAQRITGNLEGVSEVQAAAARSLDPLIEEFSDDLRRVGPLIDGFMREDPHGAIGRIAERTELPVVKALCVYAQAYPTISDSKYNDLPKEEREAVIARLQEAVEKYGKEIDHRGRVFSELVAGDIFQLERLQVGMLAPDIVGQDLDGVEFKLSDYRGKVVVIDFWGNW